MKISPPYGTMLMKTEKFVRNWKMHFFPKEKKRKEKMKLKKNSELITEIWKKNPFKRFFDNCDMDDVWPTDDSHQILMQCICTYLQPLGLILCALLAFLWQLILLWLIITNRCYWSPTTCLMPVRHFPV